MKIGSFTSEKERDFMERLGLILVVDNCRRGCLHCPAYGTTAPVAYMDPRVMQKLLGGLQALYREHGVSSTQRTMQCWRVSDPLDYHYRIGPRHYHMLDVAEGWTRYLGQGLYMVTNGSEGKPLAKKALREFVQHPEFISQAKLTITPCDKDWGTEQYRRDLAFDIETMAPLWELTANRPEDSRNALFRINVKATDDRIDEARELVHDLFRRLSLDADALIADTRRVAFKAVYDLGTATGEPTPVTKAVKITNAAGLRYKAVDRRTQHQVGIRPDLSTFRLDMYQFTEFPLNDETGELVRVSFPEAAEEAQATASAVA